MTATPLPLTERLFLAFVWFFRVLFDARFAGRVALAAKDPALLVESAPTQRSPTTEPPPAPPSDVSALTLLALLQREGRFVDFLKQDVAGFGDADIGAAARVVHEGCRRALDAHVPLARVRAEAEGTTVGVDAADLAEVTLTGNVGGVAPFRGVLRHAGWRATSVKLPAHVAGHDARVICPAEVEL